MKIEISRDDYQTLMESRKYYGEKTAADVLAHLIRNSDYVKSVEDKVRYDRVSEIGR